MAKCSGSRPNPLLLLVLFVLDFCFLLSFGAKKDSKKVLVVRLDAIGDFVLWLDAARELRTLYPKGEYTITLLANQAWAGLAEGMPYWDEVWPLDRARFTTRIKYRWLLVRRIRQACFGTVLHPNFSRESYLGDSIVRVSGAATRIGSSGDCSLMRPWVKRVCDTWYTRLIPAREGGLMELKRNAEFMRGLGLDRMRATLPHLELDPKAVRQSLPEHYFVLFPGASFSGKRWPAEQFCELGHRLHEKTGWPALVCGGPGEESLGESLASCSDFPLTDLTGCTSLEELAGIIAGARMLIGNDTAAIHIAAAVSTSAVCISGGGHYGRYFPYDPEISGDGPLPTVVSAGMHCFGCNWQCRYPAGAEEPLPCLSSISVDAVWSSVSEILKKLQRHSA